MFLQAITERQYGLRVQTEAQRSRLAKLQLLDTVLLGQESANASRGSALQNWIVWAIAQLALGACVTIANVHIKVTAACSTQDRLDGLDRHADTTPEQVAPKPVLLTVSDVCATLQKKPDPGQSGKEVLIFSSKLELHGLNFSICPGTSDMLRKVFRGFKVCGAHCCYRESHVAVITWTSHSRDSLPSHLTAWTMPLCTIVVGMISEAASAHFH